LGSATGQADQKIHSLVILLALRKQSLAKLRLISLVACKEEPLLATSLGHGDSFCSEYISSFGIFSPPIGK